MSAQVRITASPYLCYLFVEEKLLALGFAVHSPEPTFFLFYASGMMECAITFHVDDTLMTCGVLFDFGPVRDAF